MQTKRLPWTNTDNCSAEDSLRDSSTVEEVNTSHNWSKLDPLNPKLPFSPVWYLPDIVGDTKNKSDAFWTTSCGYLQYFSQKNVTWNKAEGQRKLLTFIHSLLIRCRKKTQKTQIPYPFPSILHNSPPPPPNSNITVLWDKLIKWRKLISFWHPNSKETWIYQLIWNCLPFQLPDRTAWFIVFLRERPDDTWKTSGSNTVILYKHEPKRSSQLLKWGQWEIFPIGSQESIWGIRYSHQCSSKCFVHLSKTLN